jgi:hypothetical protein
MRSLICFLLACSPASGLDLAALQEGVASTCKKCASTGRQACSEHKREECAWEDGVLFCSVVADCAVCAGAGFVDCPACEQPAAQDALTRKRERGAGLRANLERFDREMGRPLRKAESEHFEVVWEVDSLKVDKRRRDGHELLHIYVDRLERLYAEYCTVLGATPAEFREKAQVLVWWLPADQQAASLRFASQGAAFGIKLMGQHAVYSVCGNRQYYTSDEQLHRNIVHCVTHLLFAHQEPSLWIGNQRGGWAEEGLAHWFEDRFFGVCDNYCYEEQNTMVGFKSGNYRPAVRKLVADGEAPTLASLLELNTDQLSLPQHPVAFSLVDYLITQDAAGFNALAKDLRRKVPGRDAIKTHFGVSPLELETQWKAWVLATYPTR